MQPHLTVPQVRISEIREINGWMIKWMEVQRDEGRREEREGQTEKIRGRQIT